MRTIFLAAAMVAALLTGGCDRQSAGQSQAEAPAKTAQPGGPGLDRSQKGKAIPDVAILGADGAEQSLADYKGPLLLNLWATWCAPCVKELPTLDRLAAANDGKLAVVALSQDSVPQGEVESFLAKLKIENLGPDQDPQMAVSGALGTQILPTTILYGSDGKEIWRYAGDMDWTGPEAAKLLAEAR